MYDRMKLMSIGEKLKEVDYLNLAMYLSFVLAVAFYFLSAKFKTSFRVLFLIAVFFMFVGVALVIAKIFRTYSVTHTMYKTSLKEKSIKLYEEYGANSNDIERELKKYKKTALKDYRQSDRKYMFFMCILGIIDFYILYFGLSVWLNW